MVAHDFLYLPVVTLQRGNTWLTITWEQIIRNVNHASFDPTMQLTGHNDHLAYGSLFQWGRYSDGHELITWTLCILRVPQ